MVVNIAETLNQVASVHGDKIGLIEAKTGRQMSFSELNRLSDGYATYFDKKGIVPGDRVMLMVTPSADFICLTFALFKVGVTIILIDPGMGYKNLLRCIEGVKPTVFIGVPKARLFSAVFPLPFKSVRHSFCCGQSFGIFGKDIRRQINPSSTPYPVYQPADDDLAAIIFTTGSTGPPKGVRYEHAIFAAQLERIRDYYGIDAQHTDQPAFPLFALFSAALGACSVIPDMDPTRPAKVHPEKFVSSILKYGVTYSFGSPAIWNVVSRYCLDNRIMLHSLKKVLMAGAPVPGELLERVTAILPSDAEIFTPYGATESLPVISMTGKEILKDTWQNSRAGKGTCVGRPLPGIDLQVIQIQDKEIDFYEPDLNVPVGEMGEIIVRGNVVTRAYENNERETKLSKIKDKGSDTFWHRMGDIGYLDEVGRLWFCGRKAHRVITEQGTLFTIPCEAIVNEHKDVYRSALVGIPQDNGREGRIPVLIIEPVKGYRGSEQELLENVRKLAGDSPVTSQIKRFLIHPDFPVDIRHNAKIFREKLAIWAVEKCGAVS
jgi:acyl-CoA synthetase (AMP-forming)/AMP-acid ligase II